MSHAEKAEKKAEKAARKLQRARRKALKTAYYACEKAYQELVRYHKPALGMPRIKEHQDSVFHAYQYLKEQVEARPYGVDEI